DGKLTTTQTMTLTVGNINAPPRFDDLGSWRIYEGQTLQLRALALDPNNPGYLPQDRTSNGTLSPPQGTDPTLTYTVSGLPPGATFDPPTTMLTWPTGYSDAGTYLVTFTATNAG